VGGPDRTRRRIYIGPNISIVMLLLYIQYMKKRDVIHSESGRDIIQGDSAENTRCRFLVFSI
jgi:hypothetical protein